MYRLPDNPPDAWYYLAVQEAPTATTNERKPTLSHETWTALHLRETGAQYPITFTKERPRNPSVPGPLSLSKKSFRQAEGTF